MTVVEFFDRTPIENMISSLTTIPDKIIFIGDGKAMKKFDKIYQSFLKSRELNTELAYRSIKKNNINHIVDVLSEIVETEQDCVFDLTGGDDLVLVAMGMVFQKYSDKKVQMQRFNINNGVVTDCDNDGTVFYTGEPQITVEENIRLHGGVIRYKGDGEGTAEWDFSGDFAEDVDKMWSICRTNPGLWNARLNVLEALVNRADLAESLTVSGSVPALQEQMKRSGIKYVSIQGLLKILSQKRLIHSYKDDGETVCFTFKNEQVKRCLEKAGTILELKVLTLARSITDDNGTRFYNDSMNGVYIDWDGDLHDISDLEKDTENEIDVLLMKGITPIFISCKNGHVDDDELYKLEAVADRFGGIYAKKVLIATYLGKGPQSMKYFEQRAKDMKIKLIDSVHLLEDGPFAKKIRNLINN